MSEVTDRIAWAFYCRWPEKWWLPRWVWNWLTDKLCHAILERELLERTFQHDQPHD